MNKSIPYIDLEHQHSQIEEELLDKIKTVLKHGQFILGQEVENFEKQFAEFNESKYAVGVASGTDALILALKALDIRAGDEVITVPNSFLASTSSIALVGAKPVFVDVGDDFNMNPHLIEEKITPQTKAILPVHLTGRPAAMNEINLIAKNNNLYVIEDAAQAVGAKYHDKKVGNLGIAGCFSLHPLKNLNACGDAGILTTNDESIYEYILKARNHGLKDRDKCDFWSLNSRLDAMQAAILQVKLKYLDEWTEQRRSIAAYYTKHLEEIVKVPNELDYEYCVYQTFKIQAEKRNELHAYLADRGISTAIHYSIPIHLQKAANSLGYKRGDFPVTEEQCEKILSLPIYQDLKNGDFEIIVNIIKKFYKE